METQIESARERNETFKKEIRRRSKEDYFKRVRSEFLRLSELSAKNEGLNYNIGELDRLLISSPSKETVSLINRVIIGNRTEVTEQIFLRLLRFVKEQFLTKSLNALIAMPHLNDFVALCSNLLSFEEFRVHVENEIDFAECAQKLSDLSMSAETETLKLVSWLMFSLLQIKPENTLHILARIQPILVEKLGITNVYVSYLINGIAIEEPTLIPREVVEMYCHIDIADVEDRFFWNNVISTVNQFVIIDDNRSCSAEILRFVSKSLNSPKLPPLCRPSLFYVLLNLIKRGIDLPSLINLVGSGTIVSELVNRSLYDTDPKSKTICLTALNELIQKSPPLQRRQIVENFPSTIDALVAAFSLFNNDIIVSTLITITNIVITFADNVEVKQSFVNAGIITELEILEHCQNKDIAELASSIKEEAFLYS